MPINIPNRPLRKSPHNTLLIIMLGLHTLPTVAEEKQEVNQETVNPIEEIVVTAQQQNATISDTYHSVEIFTQEDLKRHTDRSLEELFGRIPNIEVDPEEGIIVRGTPIDGLDGANPTQLSLIDGAYTPGIVHFWDAKHFEILRGGQSSVGSAIGGTFGVVYNEPTFTPEGAMYANYGTDAKDGELAFAYGGPIVREKLAFRIAGYKRDREGLVENTLTNQKDWSGHEETFARAQVNWYPDPEEDTEISVQVFVQDIEKGANDWVNEIGPGGTQAFDFETAIETPVQDDTYNRDIYLRYRASLTDRLSIHALVADHKWEGHEINDANGLPTASGSDSVKRSNRATGAGSYLNYNGDKWFIGGLAYLYQFDINGNQSFLIPVDFDGGGAFPGVDARLRFDFPTDHWWIGGARVSATYTGDRWAFTGAISVDSESADTNRTSITTRITSTGIPEIDDIYDGFLAGFPNVDEDSSYSATQINPSLAVSYAFAEDWTGGIKAERSGRRGFDQINGFQKKIVNYDPETADEIDLFVRGRLLDGRGILNANLFFGKIKDQQINFCFSDAFLDCHVVNAGESHRYGLEVDSWWYWGDVRAWVAGSWLEAEFDKFDVPGREDQENRPVPNSPEWKFSMGVIYERPNGFFASFDWVARPGTNGDATDSVIINDDRRLLNTRVGWGFPNGLEISLWARNLLDEEYFETYNPNIPGAYVGDPREIGITVAKSWKGMGGSK